MKIRLTLLLLYSYGWTICVDNFTEQNEVKVEAERDQATDDISRDENRLNFQEIDEFFYDHNVLDYVTIQEPSAFMNFIRMIGCPILMAYLRTKEKIQRILSWCDSH